MPETISVPIPVSTLREMLGDDEVDAALAYGAECIANGETDKDGAAHRVGGFLASAIAKARP